MLCIQFVHKLGTVQRRFLILQRPRGSSAVVPCVIYLVGPQDLLGECSSPTAAFNRELPIRFKLAAFVFFSTTLHGCHPAVMLMLSRALGDYFWLTVETVRFTIARPHNLVLALLTLYGIQRDSKLLSTYLKSLQRAFAIRNLPLFVSGWKCGPSGELWEQPGSNSQLSTPSVLSPHIGR